MRVNEWHYAALRWYFNEYESEIGIKAMDPNRAGGSGGDPDSSFVRVRQALRRARGIETALARVPSKHRKVLCLVHMPRRWALNDRTCKVPDCLKGIVSMLRQPPEESIQDWAWRRFNEAHTAFDEAVEASGVTVS